MVSENPINRDKIARNRFDMTITNSLAQVEHDSMTVRRLPNMDSLRKLTACLHVMVWISARV